MVGLEDNGRWHSGGACTSGSVADVGYVKAEAMGQMGVTVDGDPVSVHAIMSLYY